MSSQRTTHGGPMTPRAPAGKTPMQEFSAWVVVSVEGNAWRDSLHATREGAIHAFVGASDIGGPDDTSESAWQRSRTQGYRVARVAIVEDR